MYSQLVFKRKLLFQFNKNGMQEIKMAEATSTTPEKTSVERPKVTRNRILIILSILVVTLIISNFYVYTTFKGQVDTLTTEKTGLQLQVNDLTDIVNLNKSTIIVNNQTVGQAAGTYTSWTFSAKYAGYLKVNVHTSTTTNTYVKVLYNSYSVVFDQTIMVGAGGTAVFPILPSENIEVIVGNTNLINSANERLTVTFHY